MPQPATHYWVARRAIPQFHPETQANLWELWWNDDYKSFFGLGTAAPDLFFFPLMPKVKITNKDFYWEGISNLIHHSRSYDLFCALLDYAKKSKSKNMDVAKKQFAFAFGFYCHVVTDCIFHPYVYRSTKDHWAKPAELTEESRHKFQEMLIDQGIYKEFNLSNSTSLDKIAWKCSNNSGLLEDCIATMFNSVLLNIYPDCFPENFDNPNDLEHPVQQAYCALLETADLIFQGKVVLLLGQKVRLSLDKASSLFDGLGLFSPIDFFKSPYPFIGEKLHQYSPKDLFNFSCGVSRKIFFEALKFFEEDNATSSKQFFETNYTHYLKNSNWNLDTGLKCSLNNTNILHSDNFHKSYVDDLKSMYKVFEYDYSQLGFE